MAQVYLSSRRRKLLLGCSWLVLNTPLESLLHIPRAWAVSSSELPGSRFGTPEEFHSLYIARDPWSSGLKLLRGPRWPWNYSGELKVSQERNGSGWSSRGLQRLLCCRARGSGFRRLQHRNRNTRTAPGPQGGVACSVAAKSQQPVPPPNLQTSPNLTLPRPIPHPTTAINNSEDSICSSQTV